MAAGDHRRLARTEAKRLVDLGVALVDSAHDGRASLARASYDALLPHVAELTGPTRILSYRPVADGESWSWEFASWWSDREGADRELESFGRLLQARRVTWSFNPQAPRPQERNRVVTTRDPEMRGYGAELRRTGDAIGASATLSHAMRVLVCDGPRFLAAVGCIRDQPFGDQERAAFEMLVPSLVQAHRVQRAARERAFLSAGVEAALEAFTQPAFLLDRQGMVRLASRSGERWLEREPNARERIAAVARAGSLEGTVHALPEGRGALVVIRTGVVEPSIRLRRAVDAWDLTRRQADVLTHVVGGASNKQISSALRCTETNVEAHVTQLLRRSTCANRAELTAKFWQL